VVEGLSEAPDFLSVPLRHLRMQEHLGVIRA